MKTGWLFLIRSSVLGRGTLLSTAPCGAFDFAADLRSCRSLHQRVTRTAAAKPWNWKNLGRGENFRPFCFMQLQPKPLGMNGLVSFRQRNPAIGISRLRGDAFFAAMACAGAGP